MKKFDLILVIQTQFFFTFKERRVFVEVILKEFEIFKRISQEQIKYIFKAFNIDVEDKSQKMDLKWFRSRFTFLERSMPLNRL